MISAGKTVEISVKIFFLEITSYLGPTSSIFSVCFGLHKTGGPSNLRGPITSYLNSRGAHPCLSCPRAHVRLSAPLAFGRTFLGIGLGLVFFCVLGLGREPCVLDSTSVSYMLSLSVCIRVNLVVNYLLIIGL